MAGLIPITLLLLPQFVSPPEEANSVGFETSQLGRAKVTRERFIRTVPLSGEVRTWQPAIVFNDCRNHERQIIELVPEGTWVEKGDIVCVLDCSTLMDTRNKQRIELSKAQARLANAEAREELQDAHNKRRIETNRMNYEIAAAELERYRREQSVDQRNQLIDQMQIDRRRLELQQEQLDHTARLTSLGFRPLSSWNIEATSFGARQRNLELAEGRLNLLDEFLHPGELLRLGGQARQRQAVLNRTHLESELATSVMEISTLQMRKWEAGVKTYLAYLNRAISACTMKAPKTGEVVYCHKRDEGKFIEVGQNVHYMQDILRIANRERLTVAGRISDFDVYKVSPGDSVTLGVPTLPGKTFTGQLTWVASIPSAAEWYKPQSLHHKVQVEFNPDQPGLEELVLSSTISGHVTVDDRPDVLLVPVTAVFEFDRQNLAIVEGPEGISLAPIRIGENNGSMIEVIEGLTRDQTVLTGQRVLLRQLAKSLQESGS